MIVNLLKRLESSVEAFRLTLQRLQGFHLATLTKIENFQKTGRDATFIDRSPAFENAEPEDEDQDFDDALEEPNDDEIGGKVRIELSDMDLPSWEHDLRADLAIIETLLTEMRKISPSDDAKLQHLKTLILSKIASPINPGNRKCIVFTAFSDTANYLYQHLAPTVFEKYKIHTALVTGGANPNPRSAAATISNPSSRCSPPSPKRKPPSSLRNRTKLTFSSQLIASPKAKTSKTAITSSTTTSTGILSASSSASAALTASAPATPASNSSITGQISRSTNTSI